MQNTRHLIANVCGYSTIPYNAYVYETNSYYIYLYISNYSFQLKWLLSEPTNINKNLRHTVPHTIMYNFNSITILYIIKIQTKLTVLCVAHKSSVFINIRLAQSVQKLPALFISVLPHLVQGVNGKSNSSFT